MSHLCFVTDELYPAAKGGAGALLYNTGIELTSRGHKVSFLLDIPAENYQKAREIFLGGAAPFPVETLGHVDELCRGVEMPSETELGGWYAWKSYRVYMALSRFSERHAFDGVELNDYFGSAYHSLAAKASGFYFHGLPLAVRVHNPWEILTQAGDAPITEPYVLQIQALERASLRLAEHLLIPSQGYWDATANYYPAPFMGDTIVSKPSLFKWPRAAAAAGSPKADKILFFGRLQPFKGLDRLISAMVTMAHREPASKFLLVGGDSVFSHDSSRSYREMLMRFVPAELHPRFEFTGPLDFETLGARLPEVRYAVFPNYYESFCYAAHELYEAGVPLILSDTPAFSSLFQHEKNALIFDGTIDGLVRQMERLWRENALRERLRRPYEIKQNPLGAFYDAPPKGYLDGEPTRVDVTVLILEAGAGDTAQTVRTVSPQLRQGDRCAVLARDACDPGHVPIRFLGERYYLKTPEGRPLSPDAFRTTHAVLPLRAGDALEPDALSYLMGVLAAHPQVGFAHCWRWMRRPDGGVEKCCQPLELDVERMLYRVGPRLSRTLLRVAPDSRIDDIFDIRTGVLGEIDLIWRLSDKSSGITIPKFLMTCAGGGDFLPVSHYPALCTYMIFKEQHRDRLHRLACMTLLGASMPDLKETFGQVPLGNNEQIMLSMLNKDQLINFAGQRLRVIDLLITAYRRLTTILWRRLGGAR